MPKEAQAKRDGVINPQNYNFYQFYTANLMLSKRYKSTEVDRRTWLHVPSGTPWSTSSDTHQVVEIWIETSTKMYALSNETRIFKIGQGIKKRRKVIDKTPFWIDFVYTIKWLYMVLGKTKQLLGLLLTSASPSMDFFHPTYFCVWSVTNLITNNVESKYTPTSPAIL